MCDADENVAWIRVAQSALYLNRQSSSRVSIETTMATGHPMNEPLATFSNNPESFVYQEFTFTKDSEGYVVEPALSELT